MKQSMKVFVQLDSECLKTTINYTSLKLIKNVNDLVIKNRYFGTGLRAAFHLEKAKGVLAKSESPASRKTNLP